MIYEKFDMARTDDIFDVRYWNFDNDNSTLSVKPMHAPNFIKTSFHVNFA